MKQIHISAGERLEQRLCGLNDSFRIKKNVSWEKDIERSTIYLSTLPGHYHITKIKAYSSVTQTHKNMNRHDLFPQQD